MISDGVNFALFQNIEDFLTCVSTMLVKKIFWYNAKFDFSCFDYYFATNNWMPSYKIVELFGDLPRIELFARQYADGWDCWGNEV